MSHEFNLQQMQKLIQKERKRPSDRKVHIAYVTAYSDYWENKDEFVGSFMSAPADHDVVIHVNFEGLSLTNSGIVDATQRLIQLQGRSHDTVFVFSPNSIKHDAPWPNIYWQQFGVTDEITRSELYLTDPLPIIAQPKTWALFVGRRTMPRIRALFDCWDTSNLRNCCLLSLMENDPPERDYFWMAPNRFYDSIFDWIEPHRRQQFQTWYRNCPIKSADHYSIQDQYLDHAAGDNRNSLPTLSLLKLQDQYLFEMVFETMTRGTTFTPSEKTVRTIVAQKPTVTYAPRHFLKHMQGLGFETFGDLWDESYDDLEGIPRYFAIMDIVRKIADLDRQQQLDLYAQAQDRCRRNYAKLLKYQHDNRPRNLLPRSPTTPSAS